MYLMAVANRDIDITFSGQSHSILDETLPMGTRATEADGETGDSFVDTMANRRTKLDSNHLGRYQLGPGQREFRCPERCSRRAMNHNGWHL